MGISGAGGDYLAGVSLLIWELSGSRDVPSVRHQLLSPHPFLADDGKLSLEEFQLFFADGVLNEKELEGLFHTIDSDNTK